MGPLIVSWACSVTAQKARVERTGRIALGKVFGERQGQSTGRTFSGNVLQLRKRAGRPADTFVRPMQIHTLPYSATHRFSPLVLDLLANDPGLREHYTHLPSLEGLMEAAASRSFSREARSTLCHVLQQQYNDVPKHAKLQANLERLAQADCLTITTGHQLCLFGGPLYVPFKILNIIRLAERSTSERNGKPVVPIFWMATEDHDRAEIDHTWFKGKKVVWPGEAEGAVGRMRLDGIERVVEEAVGSLGAGEHAQAMEELIRECYRPEYTLARATRLLVNSLFGRFGVICLDGDDPELKRLFIPAMQEELINQVGQRSVSYANEKLQDRYKVQAHAREINLFYLSPQVRSRIELKDDRFVVLDGGPTFTLDGLLEELNSHPERFSPNVLLRPVYQETVLPNVCYVGGGGELAYWLQLRWLFQGLQVPMPAILLRTSAAFISGKHLRQWKELGLSLEELFAPVSETASLVAKRTATFDIDMKAEQEQLKALYHGLLERTAIIDPNLQGSIEARRSSAMHGIDRIGKGFLRAAKREQSTALGRIEKIHAAVFPGGGLQERRDNILPDLAAFGLNYLDELLQILDPMANEFTVVEEASADLVEE